LNEKCTGCHNPNKTKGGLQLISKQMILKGGEDGEILVPGSPDSSMLYRFLLLPMNDDKHMPPEGKPQLDAAKIELFHWWITSGASFDNTLAALAAPDSIKKIVQDKYGQGSPLDALEISFAKTSTIQSLNNVSRGVRQLSIDKPYIDVFLANKKDLSNKDLEELKEISAQITSIDLSNSSVKDDQLGIISAFPHLRKLHLENTDVSDKGIQKLGNLKYLEYLNVSNTNVTDQLFRELTPYTSLQKLFLYGTNVPVPAITAFKSKRAGIQIGYTPDLSLDTSFRGRLTQPDVTVDSMLFVNNATIEMKYRLKGVAIHYTTNGKDPDSGSTVYSKPISIDSSCNLRVMAIKKGWESSPVQKISLLRARYPFVAAKLSVPPHKNYRARLDTTLIDLQRGEDHSDGKYLGYEGEDVTVDLDLGQAKPLHSIQVSYVQNHDAYIFAPVAIDVYGSRDGRSFTKLSSANHSDNKMISGVFRGTLAANFHETQARYIKVKIINRKILPSWHPGKGKKSWIFIDEIVSG
jgi:hypothetical protein